MAAQISDPAAMLMQMARGHYVAKALYVVAKLGLADLLANGARDSHGLAENVGCDPDALYRLLRWLSGLGVFNEEPGRCFSLTSLSDRLRSDVPDSVRGYTININEESYDVWGRLLETIRTGGPAFQEVFGCSLSEYLRVNPDYAKKYQEAMVNMERIHNPGLVEAMDFKGRRTVVDVGGGHGALLSEIMARNEHLRGILLDLETGIALAKSGAGGPLPRCEFVVGDFLKSMPAGGDVYVLKRIINELPDDDAIRVLTNCRQAMARAGRVLVIAQLIGAPNVPSFAHVQDLTMLILHGGKERSEDEYAELFGRAGLQHARTIDTPSAFKLLEAAA